LLVAHHPAVSWRLKINKQKKKARKKEQAGLRGSLVCSRLAVVRRAVFDRQFYGKQLVLGKSAA
jgi:hypothetical protein